MRVLFLHFIKKKPSLFWCTENNIKQHKDKEFFVVFLMRCIIQYVDKQHVITTMLTDLFLMCF